MKAAFVLGCLVHSTCWHPFSWSLTEWWRVWHCSVIMQIPNCMICNIIYNNRPVLSRSLKSCSLSSRAPGEQHSHGHFGTWALCARDTRNVWRYFQKAQRMRMRKMYRDDFLSGPRAQPLLILNTVDKGSQHVMPRYTLFWSCIFRGSSLEGRPASEAEQWSRPDDRTGRSLFDSQATEPWSWCVGNSEEQVQEPSDEYHIGESCPPHSLLLCFCCTQIQSNIWLSGLADIGHSLWLVYCC